MLDRDFAPASGSQIGINDRGLGLPSASPSAPVSSALPSPDQPEETTTGTIAKTAENAWTSLKVQAGEAVKRAFSSEVDRDTDSAYAAAQETGDGSDIQAARLRAAHVAPIVQAATDYATHARAVLAANQPNIPQDSAKALVGGLTNLALTVGPVVALSATAGPEAGLSLMGAQSLGQEFQAGRPNNEAIAMAAFNTATMLLPLGVLKAGGEGIVGESLKSAGAFSLVSGAQTALGQAYDAIQLSKEKGIPKMDAWNQLGGLDKVVSESETGFVGGALLGAGHAAAGDTSPLAMAAREHIANDFYPGSAEHIALTSLSPKSPMAIAPPEHVTPLNVTSAGGPPAPDPTKLSDADVKSPIPNDLIASGKAFIDAASGNSNPQEIPHATDQNVQAGASAGSPTSEGSAELQGTQSGGQVADGEIPNTTGSATDTGAGAAQSTEALLGPPPEQYLKRDGTPWQTEKGAALSAGQRPELKGRDIVPVQVDGGWALEVRKPIETATEVPPPSDAAVPPSSSSPGATAGNSVVTPDDIHAAAKAAGIPSDNDPAFQKWTQHLTGQQHLDDMTPAQLEVVRDKIAQGEKPHGDSTKAAGEQVAPAAPTSPPEASRAPAPKSDSASPVLSGKGEAEPKTTVVKAKKVRVPPTAEGGHDALTILAAHGGLRDDEGHDLRSAVGARFIPGHGPLIRKNGRSLEQAGEILHQDGFFGPTRGEDAVPMPSEGQVIDLLQRASKSKVYLPELQASREAEIAEKSGDDSAARVRDEIEALAKDHGEPLPKAEVDQVMRLMVEHGVDAEHALDLHYESDLGSALDSAGHASGNDHYSDIPFETGPPESAGAGGEGHERSEGAGRSEEPPQARAPPAEETRQAPGQAPVNPDEAPFSLRRGEAPPTRKLGVPDKAASVTSHETDAAIKADPDYKAAKAGDIEAAARMIPRVVRPETLDEAREKFGEGATYVPVVAEEATGKNAIPSLTAQYYAEATGGHVDTGITQVSRAYHTGARPLERLISRPVFDGPVVKGRRYVLVDDVSVMGGTLAELANHIRAQGGEVVGVATLVNASRTGQYAAKPVHSRLIEGRFGDEIRKHGVEPSALTGDEAQYLLGFKDADGLRDSIAKATRERGERLRSKGLRTSAPDGEENGSLRAADTSPRVTRSFADDATTKLRNALVARLQRTDPTGKLALRLVEKIQAFADGRASEADGRYLRGLIEISLEAPDAGWTLNHEIIHGLKDLGLFKSAEWTTLKKAAPSDTAAMDEVRQRYKDLGLTEDQLIEERVADMFADWSAGKIKPTGFIRDAFSRLVSFIKAIHASLTDAGYRSMDDIFQGVDEGRVGAREAETGDGGERLAVNSEKINTVDGKRDQLVIPGAEQSARQAAESRGDKIKPKAPQKDPGGMFAEPDRQGSLFSMRRTSRDVEKAPLTDDKGKPRWDVVKENAARVREATVETAKEVRMALNPMSEGSTMAIATAKDFMNAQRLSRDWQNRMDQFVTKHFTPEQQERMWQAGHDQDVLQERENARIDKLNETAPDRKTDLVPKSHFPGKGYDTLSPEEYGALRDMQTDGDEVFNDAIALGMIEDPEKNGYRRESYVPRRIVDSSTGKPFVKSDGESSNPLDMMGRNLRTSSKSLMNRKHETVEETEKAAQALFGENAKVVRNIRTLPLVTAELRAAVAGRTLINEIRRQGLQSGEPTVFEGYQPEGIKTFTIDHPAMFTMRPKFQNDPDSERQIQLKDENGKMLFERVPLYIRGDFEGPLRAILSTKDGRIYSGLMQLKAKTMSAIMYSPLIHNGVEWGRAMAAFPGKVFSTSIYFQGNAARRGMTYTGVFDHMMGKHTASEQTLPQDVKEAINSGMVPIGHRGAFQDISSIAEPDDIRPGQSWTAQILSAVPGLFDPRAADAVKRAVDKAGDIWHNKLLWDRVADLQMGLYVNFRDSLTAKGFDPKTAQRLAAHLANRYAGALPIEAMSAQSRKLANVLLFSRSFTFGNLGAMKDALVGLPGDIKAQIMRDAGDLATKTANTTLRRKSQAIIAVDIALRYIASSALASTIAVLLGQTSAKDEAFDYLKRAYALSQRIRENPMQLLSPLQNIQSLTPMSRNEPGKQDRIYVGHADDGSAIYANPSLGKVAGEFEGWATGSLEQLNKKLSTFARPVLQTFTNEKGFGGRHEHVYDPYDEAPGYVFRDMGKIVLNFFQQQVPLQSMEAAAQLLKSGYQQARHAAQPSYDPGPQADQTVNKFETFGPLFGTTFSKGAKGGEAMGEYWRAKDKQDEKLNEAMPDIRQQIKDGDTTAARQAMSELNIKPSTQSSIIRSVQNPKSVPTKEEMKDFRRYATPDELDRFNDARDRGAQ